MSRDVPTVSRWSSTRRSYDPGAYDPGARVMALATSVQVLLTENPVLGWFAGSLGATFSRHTVRLPLTLGPPWAVRTHAQTAMSESA